MKRFSKSAWKAFKIDFEEVELRLSEAKDDIIEELQLASERAAHEFRGLLTEEVKENRLLREKHVLDIDENKKLRLQQTLALQATRDERVQKILKEEGKIELLHGERDSAIKLTMSLS